MRTTRNLAVTVASIAALLFTGSGMLFSVEARAAETGSGPTITITNEGASYVYNPAQLEAKVGQAITLTNKDPNGVHAVTARDRSFSVDVPPQSSVTLTISKAGSYAYYCQYHPESHNPASINIS